MKVTTINSLTRRRSTEFIGETTTTTTETEANDYKTVSKYNIYNKNVWILIFKNDYIKSAVQIVTFRVDFQRIKWKNQRALPGTAYSPTEVEHLANVITHGIWIVPAFVAWLQLIWRSKSSSQMTVACIYGATLTLLFLISTIFHSVFYLERNRKLQNALHRCDRAMIYIFIAGSYFPWLNLSVMAHFSIFNALQWCIWLLAAIGITYQQIYHERFKCLETTFYLIMGLGPALFLIFSDIDFPGYTEVKLGGLLYIIGLVFFKCDGYIPLAHAIWHVFVILASATHYYAILKYLYPIHLPQSS